MEKLVSSGQCQLGDWFRSDKTTVYRTLVGSYTRFASIGGLAQIVELFLSLGSDQGQYLLLSSSFINQQTVVAVVQSETFPATSVAGRCLTFWFVIRGNQLGRVDVNITTSKDSSMIWSLGSVDQGDEWRFASVGYYANEDHNVKQILFLFSVTHRCSRCLF